MSKKKNLLGALAIVGEESSPVPMIAASTTPATTAAPAPLAPKPATIPPSPTVNPPTPAPAPAALVATTLPNGVKQPAPPKKEEYRTGQGGGFSLRNQKIKELTDRDVAKMGLSAEEMKKLSGNMDRLRVKMAPLYFSSQSPTTAVMVTDDAYQRLRHFKAVTKIPAHRILSILLGWSIPAPSLDSYSAPRNTEIDDLLDVLESMKSGLFKAHDPTDLPWEAVVIPEPDMQSKLQLVQYTRHRVLDFFLAQYLNKTGASIRDVMTSLVLYYLPPSSIRYTPKIRRKRQ